MGTIKDRDGIDLTKAEIIKKWWQEYTEELYKKDLNDPDNLNGVLTHLEPDILECEVKWALKKPFFFFLIFPCYTFSWVYLSLSPLPFTPLLFSAIFKASSDNHLPSCISFSWG